MTPIYNLSGTICNRCRVIISPYHTQHVVCARCAGFESVESIDLDAWLKQVPALPCLSESAEAQAIMDAWADEVL